MSARSVTFALLLTAGVFQSGRVVASPDLDLKSWIEKNGKAIVTELAEFVAIPNHAAEKASLERNAEALQALCTRRGMKVQTLKIPGAPPLVVADLSAPKATRTIAFYAHYDGQPVDAKRWTSDPWTPVMRDQSGAALDFRAAEKLDPEWRLFGRAASDDKAPIIAMLAALDLLKARNTTPALNLRFVFEGEEESGSPHLDQYLQKYAALLRPDAWILCDGPVHQSRRMSLYFGARGVIDLEITVHGPATGLHDGHYGNWVSNPAAALARLIASMRDDNGRITIADFYDEVRAPTAAEVDALKTIPDVEEQLRAQFQIAGSEGAGKPLNELLMQPALNVRGLEAGRVGEEAANVIPTKARASIDFRLVPDQKPETVKRLVEQHLQAQGFTIVRQTPDAQARRQTPNLVEVSWGSGYPAARTPLDIPLSRDIAAIMTAAGHPPVLLPTMGGSIPMYLFQQPGDTPVVGLPIVNHDNNQHAADENLRLQNLWTGIEIFAALFANLGK